MLQTVTTSWTIIIVWLDTELPFFHTFVLEKKHNPKNIVVVELWAYNVSVLEWRSLSLSPTQPLNLFRSSYVHLLYYYIVCSVK